MYECFVSSRLAAGAILDLLAGRAATLEPYEAARRRRARAAPPRLVEAEEGARPLAAASWRIARTKLLWRSIERLLLGELAHPGEQRGVARVPLRCSAILGAAHSRSGAGYLPTRMRAMDLDALLAAPSASAPPTST